MPPSSCCHYAATSAPSGILDPSGSAAPGRELRGLAAYIEPSALNRELIPTAIATWGSPSAAGGGGAVFALRHSPSTLGLGGDRRLLGQSCATSSLDQDRAGGIKNPLPHAVPRLQLGPASPKGSGAFRGRWWDFARPPSPPGTPLSPYSASATQFHLAPGTPHPTLTCTLPLRVPVLG